MERDYSEDLGVDGRILIKWILKNWDSGWNALIWRRIGTGGNELSSSIKFS
jgi:hypothetical protein